MGGWAEEARADAAADSRRRARWLSHRAVEESSLVDILARGGPEVIVHTGLGRHRGTITEVGGDFVTVTTAAGPVYVALAAVATVEVSDRRRSQRAPTRTDQSLGAALAGEIGGEGVVIVTTSGPSCRGELAVVGEDFLLIHSDVPAAPAAYIPLRAVVSVATLREA